LSQHDKNDRAQSRQNKQGKRIGTTVLLAAASLLGTTLGVKATTQEEPAAPVQGPAGQTAGPAAGHKTLVAETIKVTTPTAPHITQKTIGTNQSKIKTPTSNQLKYQSNQIKGTTSNQLKLETNQGKF